MFEIGINPLQGIHWDESPKTGVKGERMHIKNKNMTAIGVSFLLASGLFLQACGGAPASNSATATEEPASDSSSVMVDSTIDEETSASASSTDSATSDTDSSAKESSKSDTKTKNGTDEYRVNSEMARKIFSCTIDGIEYSLPTNASSIADAGWAFGSRNSADGTKLIEPHTGSGNVYLTYGEVNEYGWSDKQIYIDYFNGTDEEKAWNECSLVGLGCQTDRDGLETWNSSNDHADFKTGFGINIGDDISSVIQMFGTWNIYDDDALSTSFKIIDESTNDLLGFIYFDQIDGTINSINIKSSSREAV